MININNYTELERIVKEEDLVFGYVSQPLCSVCKSLLPKVESLIEDYPKITSIYIDTKEVPEAAGQLSIFSIPTVLLFVQGNEYFRLVRTFGLSEIKDKIDRVYEHFQ
jgi:thioredoxin-like negative regulator of GroEL